MLEVKEAVQSSVIWFDEPEIENEDLKTEEEEES
jgi:hypothetical protein